MQIRLPNSGLLERKRHRLATFTAALCLVCFALAQGASQLTNTKRITAVQLAESAEGSRVTVTGDSLLDDYEAFRRGDRFYVRIPATDFVAAQPSFQGKGFEDVQVQKVGDSVVISFRLQPGANARVIGAANRLDVIFTSPNNLAVNNSPTAVRNRVIRNSAGQKSLSTRSGAKAGPDVAGPMPPDSPTRARDYSVSNEASAMAAPRSRSSQRDASRANSFSTNAAVPAITPAPAATEVPLATPYPTASPYSTTYAPVSATYSPAPVQPVAQTGRSLDLDGRSRAFLQLVRTNKTLAAGVGIAVMGLLGVVLFFFYRRRRSRRAAVANAPRVQPKYSPEDEFEDMLAASVPNEASKVDPRGYVDQQTYESWDENISSDNALVEDLTTNTRRDVTYDEVVAPTPHDVPTKESWEYVPESNPQAYKSRVQEEREVFEL